ncbi:stage V sporulation protein AD [Sinanaerobacter sp. ZZT-01]|uniref:stage V sporulation protein AD n=1 Tax=Sinanaerobacter sp. ZZT-01 TaxID=3111540 RepID=UPI002D795E52|nr:stage V sporulation protein AD [Sinanaerobacter sp. ZZT-01]WRR92657.1 stage V sporulation protein AD [Sinanaerobacter sp. ZZT-01]
MQENKIGKQTFVFHNEPNIIGAAAVVGKKEGQGPMSKWFDVILKEDTYGEKTWEKSESKILKKAILLALQNSGKTKEELDTILSGDLINQLMSSSFMARDLQIPFLGLYGACSTMTESLILGAVLIDGGYAKNIVAAASSHYCTAERQFRMPLEHGNQRPPSAQWTVTGAGSMILSNQIRDGEQMIGGEPAKNLVVTHATVGKIVDAGIKDANQMGAAMAPATVDTIFQHLKDTGREASYYDVILSGDLGIVGKQIVIDLLKKENINLDAVYDDCGVMIFNKDQDVHSGGSGCGCSASIFSGHIFKEMRQGKIKKALLISTGALLSTISSQQGESIPGIAHAVAVEGR